MPLRFGLGHGEDGTTRYLQAEFFERAVAITKDHKAMLDGKGLKKVADFRASLKDDDESGWPAPLAQLRKDVSSFALRFPAIGYRK